MTHSSLENRVHSLCVFEKMKIEKLVGETTYDTVVYSILFYITHRVLTIALDTGYYSKFYMCASFSKN